MKILSTFGQMISVPGQDASKQIVYSVYSFNGNDIGTVKDVGSDETVQKSVDNGANVIVNVTSGNNGAALKNAVLSFNKNVTLEDRVKVVHIVPKSKGFEAGLSGSIDDFEYSIPLTADLKDRWLTKSQRERLAEKLLKNDSNFKIKKVSDVTHFVPDSYVSEAKEVLLDKRFSQYLDYLVIPVGSGRVFTAFYRALKELNAEGLEIQTKLVGIVPKGEHPLYHTFVSNGKITNYRPKSLADKLSCPNTDLLGELRRAKKEGHEFLEINNIGIEHAIKEYEKNRIASFHAGGNIPVLEPSGLAAYCIIPILELGVHKEVVDAKRVGIFTTGHGAYSSSFPQSVIISRSSLQRFLNDYS